jgi:hypothetical protein
VGIFGIIRCPPNPLGESDKMTHLMGLMAYGARFAILTFRFVLSR